jgi:DNA-binding transcriptional LysR family regulator
MLESFEAAARSNSFARAAEELLLSQSAVSRSILGLEDLLGVKLFERSKQRVVLTEPGRIYATVVSELLERLEAETALVIARGQADPTLRLATYPTFGSRWLMQRLPDFAIRHPDIELNFSTGVTPFNVHSGELDVAIQHGRGEWQDTLSIKLIDEHLIAVAAPTLLEGKGLRPEDIQANSLLTLNTRPHDWSTWFASHGLNQPTGHMGPAFQTFGLMIGAARAGVGVALVPGLYVEEELRAKRLIAAFGSAIPSQNAFYAVCDARRVSEDKISKFMAWVASQGNSE